MARHNHRRAKAPRFLKSMITDASQADAASIMVHAGVTIALAKCNYKDGVLQGWTHSRLINLLGVEQICVGVYVLDCDTAGLRCRGCRRTVAAFRGDADGGGGRAGPHRAPVKAGAAGLPDRPGRTGPALSAGNRSVLPGMGGQHGQRLAGGWNARRAGSSSP